LTAVLEKPLQDLAGVFRESRYLKPNGLTKDTEPRFNDTHLPIEDERYEYIFFVNLDHDFAQNYKNKKVSTISFHQQQNVRP
jgi:hypothetical protein